MHPHFFLSAVVSHREHINISFPCCCLFEAGAGGTTYSLRGGNPFTRNNIIGLGTVLVLLVNWNDIPRGETA
ncbi:hypothetical protein HS088_TW03G00958 [Tripterygium wilfordii]|uniref:Uncharacterized protein n=1 Tax=Tripterygium wilfordii TaxID=458696 RepID=A0A7J7DWF3_TRIWF|nr:hypothetical protein HS088_TW03G00958 [Tripterygium wilfordii]